MPTAPSTSQIFHLAASLTIGRSTPAFRIVSKFRLLCLVGCCSVQDPPNSHSPNYFQAKLDTHPLALSSAYTDYPLKEYP